jgi:hypothetical protein
VFNASRVQLSYPSLASLPSMQLTFEYQFVIYTRRSIRESLEEVVWSCCGERKEECREGLGMPR